MRLCLTGLGENVFRFVAPADVLEGDGEGLRYGRRLRAGRCMLRRVNDDDAAQTQELGDLVGYKAVTKSETNADDTGTEQFTWNWSNAVTTTPIPFSAAAAIPTTNEAASCAASSPAVAGQRMSASVNKRTGLRALEGDVDAGESRRGPSP
jgi:hypothetical protein